MKTKEIYLATACLLLFIALAIGAAYSNPYWQALLINLSTTALGLAIALIVINVYLDRSARREAVRPLLKLIAPAIGAHHNDLIHAAWDRFGKPQFGEIAKRYTENNGDPRALTPDERNSLYDIIKTNRDRVLDLLGRIDNDLRELVVIIGWSFDPDILKHAFSCRYAISQLRIITFDDSNDAKLAICEQFLDADMMAFAVLRNLHSLIGSPKEELFT